MNTQKSLISCFTGTSAMTLYSYLLSNKKNRTFKEPLILGKVIYRLTSLTSQQANIFGWVLHYCVGLFFSIIYVRLWEGRSLIPNFILALLLGAASGIFGALIWKAVLTMHPNPPKLHYKRFYAQLIPAHIVFGVFDFGGYILTNKVNRLHQTSEY